MLSPDSMSVLHAGTSLIVGTVGADGEPCATRAFALSIVDAATRRVRVVVSADDPQAVEQLGSGVIALTAGDVRTLRSVQMKGRIMAVEPATAADAVLLADQSERFFHAVQETDGHPIDLIRRILPIETVAVEFVVDEVFDQSPGPTAGRRVDVGAP